MNILLPIVAKMSYRIYGRITSSSSIKTDRYIS